MARRRSTSGSAESQGRQVSGIVKLWLLRLLVPLRGHKVCVRPHGFNDDSLAAMLGLEEFADSDADEVGEFPRKQVLAALRKRHLEAERTLGNSMAPAALSENVKRIASLVGLSETECRLLELAVMLKSESVLTEAAECVGNLTTTRMYTVLSVLLDLTEQDVKASFSSRGALVRSGILSVDRSGSMYLPEKLEMLTAGFCDLIVSEDIDPAMLLRDTVRPSAQPRLALTDYQHVKSKVELLRPYLAQACISRQMGVNILLYGPPGTGKSELARTIAREIGCELFEVASEDAEGSPVEGAQRLRSLLAAQRFFARRRTLILFDEVEDVFDDGNGREGGKSTAQVRKAWINHMLEENPIPTLWISNHVHCLDPAFVRRFDMVIELPVPPRKQRERIVRNACGDMLPQQTVARIAEMETLAPAVIARAVAVVRSIQDELPQDAVSGAVEQLVSSTLEAQGHAPLKSIDANRLPEFYDPAFINASADLAAVARGLEQSRSGRLCLYGPPGTGKTAFGRWLAGRLDIPLYVKRASDLISMWVGQTERNFARAFREAEEDGALLLIDEVDSFLQDRRGAQHSWEVTEVNEMLTQMESFSGIFIASTNLVRGLDQAALRRFDLKVEFGFLRPDQARRLFEKHCLALGLGETERSLTARLDRLAALTPGDFAAVARQHRFRPVVDATDLLARLADECTLKEGGKSAVGFI